MFFVPYDGIINKKINDLTCHLVDGLNNLFEYSQNKTQLCTVLNAKKAAKLYSIKINRQNSVKMQQSSNK